MAHISDDVLDAVRTDGFALMPGFLDSDELAEAQAGVYLEFPRPDDYFADPAAHARVVRHQFAGLRPGPYQSWDLNRIAFHPDLVDAAERFCGTTDLQLYKIELWGKYSGAVDFDQTHHRDFANHSLVVPRRDGRWPQLTTFLLLSDVTETNGPTKVLPRRLGDSAPMWPQYSETDEAMRENEVSITGPAGSVLLYTTDVLHRGSAMTGHPESRFVLLSDFSERGNPWMGKMAWPAHAPLPQFVEMIERATVRARDLFGFPPPGHEYWNEQTLHDVGQRYPNLDLRPYAGGQR